MDVALAMAEVLISTCGGPNECPGRGHEHAMQAIQLLASVYDRLDQTIDLFFDLVERFCAQSWSRGTMSTSANGCISPFPARMMQNYDQTLLKLISKHWIASGPTGTWDIVRPIERIRDLRDVYAWSEGSKGSILGRVTRKDTKHLLFSESYHVLRKFFKQRSPERARRNPTSRNWTRKNSPPKPSASSCYSESTSQYSWSISSRGASSGISKSGISVQPPRLGYESIPKEVAVDDSIIRIDALADMNASVDSLYPIIENSYTPKCK